mgnify:CR=1 FL=1
MTAEFIVLVFWGGLIFVLAKAPKEFVMIMLTLSWLGMFLVILWAIGRLAFKLLFG